MLCLQPQTQFIQPRASFGLPDHPPFCRQLAAYPGFDTVQRGNPYNRFGRDRRAIRSIDIDKFTSNVRPTSRLLNVPSFIQGIEPGIGIGLQHTLE